jgi:hypothetical protein
MSRQLFEIEKGLSIAGENGEQLSAILTGILAPDGVSGEQGNVPIGSLYLRSGTAEVYQKVANVGAASDWELTTQIGIGTWRPEKIRVVTNDLGVVAGSPRDLVANPFSDDEGALLSASDFTVGEYIIANNVLLEVTDVSAPSVTFSSVSAGLALQESDTFITPNYLPDSPADQEGQAIVTYNGSVMVKISDIDWNFATGISLGSGYSAASGDVTASDTVQSALEKIDGNNDAQDTLLGTAQGATGLGTFSGNTITSQTVKGALQNLETAHEEVDQNVNDLITLSGSPENSVDHGTFTNNVISDNQTTKGALEELGLKDEAQDLVVQEIDANVDDLISLSGVAENSANLGAFTGFGAILFTATETIKSSLQKIANFLGSLRSVEVAAVTTEATIDELPVASAGACKWLVYIIEDATPANRQAVEVYALNNGTSSDETVYAKLRVGANFNYSILTDVSGGNMRLRVSSTTAGVTVRARRIAVEDL